MSTEINIRKRIDIQEEGVSITPDVNSINFIGAGVTASTVGDNVTVNVQGSVGATAYYLNETIAQAPYKEFSSIPTAAAEQTIATVVGVGATATIQSFQTPSGVPNTTNIPAGLWQFYLHFSGTAGNSWDVYAEVYKRDLGGIETLLLTTDIIPTTALSAIPTMILTDGVFPASTVLTTDRIVVKVLATNTGVAGQTITFHTEGATNYSVGTTTLNQIVPTGAVTSVTGTAPVVSSGGTTPAISMAQANGTTDGYLDSADWTTFNNKVDDNIYTADGIVTGDRQVDLAGNDLFFNDGFFASRFRFNSDDGSSSTLIDAGPSGISIGTSGGGTGKNINVTTTQIGLDGRFTVDNTKNTSNQNLDVVGQTKTTTFQMTTTPVAGYVLTSDASGNGSWSAAAGGLTYFTEAQNTAAPNATVPVDSLTAVSAATDADVAFIPKGTGAILAAVPNNLTSGGNKRGQYAVDWQMLRNANTRIASGNRSVIIGGYNNAATNTYSIVGGESNQSLGYASVVFGTSNVANDTSGVAIGNSNNINGQSSVGLGESNTIAAGRNYAFAAGGNNTISTAGQYQTALGYFNTVSNNVAVGIGYQNTASGSAAVALGQQNIASGTNSFANGILGLASGNFSSVVGGYGSTASGITSIAGGDGSVASATNAVALGGSNVADAASSVALGLQSSTFGIIGRNVFASGQEATRGDAQASKFILRERTTNDTATTITTNSGAAGTTNQVILSNQSAYRFKGSIVGKQSGSVNAAVWDIDGFLVRGANAAATTLNISNVTLVQNTPAWGTPTLAADTTNGGLRVQVIGAAATNIQWTAVIDTTEVIYA